MFGIRQSASFDSKSRGFVDPADVLYAKRKSILLITETGAARAPRERGESKVFANAVPTSRTSAKVYSREV